MVSTHHPGKTYTRKILDTYVRQTTGTHDHPTDFLENVESHHALENLENLGNLTEGKRDTA